MADRYDHIAELLRTGMVKEALWLLGSDDRELAELEQWLAQGFTIQPRDGNPRNMRPDNMVLMQAGPAPGLAQGGAAPSMRDSALRCFARLAEMFPDLAAETFKVPSHMVATNGDTNGNTT